MPSVLEQIKNLLDENHIDYKLIHHNPTYTSEDSARERNEDIKIGAKAIVMKTDAEFRLFVLRSNLKIDSSKIRKQLNIKNLRFATPDELKEMTNLVPGSVPPFGKPILPFDIYLDESFTTIEKMAFNAGSLTDSIIMKTQDYMNLVRPKQICISQ